MTVCRHCFGIYSKTVIDFYCALTGNRLVSSMQNSCHDFKSIVYEVKMEGDVG